ncbi:MAG: diguanylate cyclase [Butyrivibrio sp.]|nr:diguanylate cyclase [Butyrivibrio sp.]
MKIGLVISELEDNEVKRICIGANKAAKDKGVTLVMLPGKYLVNNDDIDQDNPYKYQSTALFDYASKLEFDALVVDIERIGRDVAILKKESLLKNFTDIPFLTLTEQEGYVSSKKILSDHEQLERQGYQAICDAISYAKTGELSNEEPPHVFSFIEESDEKALNVVSQICTRLFNRKFEEDALYKKMGRINLELGVQNWGIFLYDRKIRNTFKLPWEFPENINIKSAVVNGSEIVDGKKTVIETSKILSVFDKEAPKVFVAGNIFIGEYQLGLMITEFDPKILVDNYFESLVSIATAGSRVSYLETELDKTREALYEVQEELAKDDSVLDHIGGEDYLTGGLNRRGFFAKAYDYLKENFEPGCYAVVAYIRMDSLKKINDVYGHEEGDRAVKEVSMILEEVFKDSVYGRIRGDEFAAIEIVSEEGKAEALRQEMSSQNADLLARSNRYINYLQYAICEFSYEENLSLREMLKETDEGLKNVKGSF